MGGTGWSGCIVEVPKSPEALSMMPQWHRKPSCLPRVRLKVKGWVYGFFPAPATVRPGLPVPALEAPA